MDTDVVIIGGGLAGLACASRLEESGLSYLLLEKSSKLGGRVKTDEYEGYLLDHGFQVLLTSYPFARSILNFDELNLQRFHSGALSWDGREMQGVYNPLRHPLSGIKSVLSSIGSLSDKFALSKLALSSLGITKLSAKREGISTQALFDQSGLSSKIQNSFLSPFFKGIYLDSTLSIDASFARFLFNMFFTGSASLPSSGMKELPAQLMRKINPKSIRLSAEVNNLESNSVSLSDGATLQAKSIVLATDLWSAARLLKTDLPKQEVIPGTYCLYFGIEGAAPIEEPVLILNGCKQGLWNNLCFPSDVSQDYAPPGYSLCSVSVLLDVLRDRNLSEKALEQTILKELAEVFGEQVSNWKPLKHFKIEYALPPLSLNLESQHILAGDYVMHPSIEGALLSGTKAANAAIAACKQSFI